MEIKKRALTEIIDSNGDLIGLNSIPSTGSDLESQANNTTDYNTKIGTQPFRYDMLGRFGFNLMPFFEGKEDEEQNDLMDDLAKLMYDKYLEILEYYFRNPNHLKSDYRLHTECDFETQPEEGKEFDVKWAKKIIEVIHPYLDSDESKSIDEGAVAEDKVLDKKSDDEMSKKDDDKDVREKKLEKIAGLINKLEKGDIDKLINLLERK